MARLTYGFLAAAAAALIAGFFVKGSSLPLLISISLSVAVSALILYGWSRVVRDEDVDAEADDAVEEIDVDEPVEMPEPPPRRRSRAAKLDETVTIEPPDDSLFAPPKPRSSTPRSTRKPKTPAAKPKASAAKPKAKPQVRSKAKPPAKPAPPKPAPAKPKATVPKKPSARKPAAKRVAVVPGASKYHKPTCRFARSDNVRMVREGVAKDRGYAACDICKP